jgi:hypothetical protein
MNNIVIQPQYAVSDIERMARAFATSKLFGVQTPDQALALCLIAQAEGRHPASAAQDYHIIHGRPSKKADAMLRDFLANGGKVEWHSLTDTDAEATFSHPSGGTVRISWDMLRAKKAEVFNNPMWNKYPRQMLRARVVSEGVRTVYPMATSGMYVPEEVEDFEPGQADPAPAEASAAPSRQPDPRTIDGTATTVSEPAAPPRGSITVKSDPQATYSRLSKANSTCTDIIAFNRLWTHKATDQALASLTDDLKATIRKERDEKQAELKAAAAPADDPFPGDLPMNGREPAAASGD